ncbi:MAG TPA: nucleotide pyrophosphohydrolase [Patescibacteria group bacterium]|nr:nucleotide pyrophosphohydrolase [Patescibacteria group bacterium]
MPFKKIQKEVNDWISRYEIGYWKPLEMLAALTEEVGEVARELNHRFGPKKKKATEVKANLEGELADIIYAVVCIANSQKIDLDAAWKKLMKKLNTRDKDRWEKK